MMFLRSTYLVAACLLITGCLEHDNVARDPQPGKDVGLLTGKPTEWQSLSTLPRQKPGFGYEDSVRNRHRDLKRYAKRPKVGASVISDPFGTSYYRFEIEALPEDAPENSIPTVRIIEEGSPAPGRAGE